MKIEQAVFAGGCFWCTEALFQSLKGVVSVTSGYTGGTTDNPSYEQVSSGKTGHAEAIRIEFDPSRISFSDLLAVFFNTHDPTTLNRQGADVGTQYRSAIFYTSDTQKNISEQLIGELTQAHAYDNPIVTEVISFKNFFPAEGYHQNYYVNNTNDRYCQIVIAPKLKKLNDQFSALLDTANLHN